MPDELKPPPHDGTKPPPPHPEAKHDIPPHILKEIMDLKEKVGKLEGMVEVLMKIVVQSQ